MGKELSQAGKEDLAVALILLRDWKGQGKGFDADLAIAMFKMADHLGVRAELDKLQTIIPPMRIEPR